MSDLYCVYCGSPKGDRIQCCKENHWLSAEDYKAEIGEWPDDGREESEWYDELSRGYANDRI